MDVHDPAGLRPRVWITRVGELAEAEVTATTIAEMLEGITFPATKAALLAQAEKNRACCVNAADALAILRRLPERTYAEMRAVTGGIAMVR